MGYINYEATTFFKSSPGYINFESMRSEHGLRLDDITLSIYLYILENIDSAATYKSFLPLYKRIKVTKPKGPFFINLCTHFYRRMLDLPVDDRNPVYAVEEIQQTINILK